MKFVLQLGAVVLMGFASAVLLALMDGEQLARNWHRGVHGRSHPEDLRD